MHEEPGHSLCREVGGSGVHARLDHRIHIRAGGPSYREAKGGDVSLREYSNWRGARPTIYQFEALTMLSIASSPRVRLLNVSVSAEVSTPSLFRGSKKCSWRNSRACSNLVRRIAAASRRCS